MAWFNIYSFDYLKDFIGFPEGFIGNIIISILFFAYYVYFALTFMTIAKKLEYEKSWLAWIPVANFAMILTLGGFYWPWIFMIFVPVLGWIALAIMGIIAQWRIFEKRGYPGWLIILSLAPFGIGFVIYLIEIGFVAWKDRR